MAELTALLHHWIIKEGTVDGSLVVLVESFVRFAVVNLSPRGLSSNFPLMRDTTRSKESPYY